MLGTRPYRPGEANLVWAGRQTAAVRMTTNCFDLAIFDCDGVVVDSEPIINRAHAQVLTACGYPISEDDLLARFRGMSDAEMLGIIKHEPGRALLPSYAPRALE
jgi:hypothetical protein